MVDTAAIQSSLLDNAFAFLERAIAEFNEDHRFSVTHFAIATELFLKARLIEEHWSLLFKDVDRATTEAFERGEFQSVTVAQSLTRLRAIAGIAVTKEAEEIVVKIGGHRNRVVHFTMHHATEEDKDKAQRELAFEQLKGWFHIQRLLRQWFGNQEELVGTLWRINRDMQGHREFLAVVFAEVSPDIEAKRNTGAEFRNCARCAFEASERLPISNDYSEMACLVCGFHDSLVAVPCPQCANILEATGYEATYPTCANCGHELVQRELSDILDTEDAEYPDVIEKNCAECSGYHTVVEHDEIYVCLQCFGYADEMPICGWCHEGQINGGDLDFSFHTGCDFCDGHGDRD